MLIVSKTNGIGKSNYYCFMCHNKDYGNPLIKQAKRQKSAKLVRRRIRNQKKMNNFN